MQRPASSPVSRRSHVSVEAGNTTDEEVELLGPAGAHAAATTATAATGPPKRRQNSYSRNDGRVILSKDAMEMEIKQMKSFNREVYEGRVRRSYLEERVCRALYTQKLALQRNEKLATQRERTAQRIARETALNTPFLRNKADSERYTQMHEIERAHRAPRFNDLAQIEARLVAANLAARGVAPSDRFAQPASAYELTLKESTKLPPNGSLMNPRNQCTSPLPDKKLLLQHLPKTNKDDAGILSLRGLVTQLVALFDAKRNADLEAAKRFHERFLQPRRTCSPSITITGSHHISLDLIYIPHIPLYPAISSSGYREKSAQGRDEILAIKFPFR